MASVLRPVSCVLCPVFCALFGCALCGCAASGGGTAFYDSGQPACAPSADTPAEAEPDLSPPRPGRACCGIERRAVCGVSCASARTWPVVQSPALWWSLAKVLAPASRLGSRRPSSGRRVRALRMGCRLRCGVLARPARSIAAARGAARTPRHQAADCGRPSPTGRQVCAADGCRVSNQRRARDHARAASQIRPGLWLVVTAHPARDSTHAGRRQLQQDPARAAGSGIRAAPAQAPSQHQEPSCRSGIGAPWKARTARQGDMLSPTTLSAQPCDKSSRAGSVARRQGPHGEAHSRTASHGAGAAECDMRKSAMF
jgi:hypothetical protein